MTDLALAAAPMMSPTIVGAPAAAAAPGALGLAIAAAPGSEGATDPFAALLASMTPNAGTDASAAPAAPVATVMPMPTALPVSPAKVPMLVSGEEPVPVAEHESAETGEQSADDDADDPDQGEDPQLAMMLAIASPPPAAAAAVARSVAPKADQEPAIAVTTPNAASAKAPQIQRAPAEMADNGQQDINAAAEAAPGPQTPAQLRAARFAMLAAQLMGGTAPTQADAAQAAMPIAAPIQPTPDGAPLPPAAIDQPETARLPGVTFRRTSAEARVPVAKADMPGATDKAADRVRMSDPDIAPFASPATQTGAAADVNGPAAIATAAAPDNVVHRELSIARDGQWLDTLARDIAATAGKDGQMSFRLDPQHLGSLTVHIRHSDDGASIRLTADTEAARQILSDAQPRLAAEARAQGLTLRDTSVDLGGSGAGQGGQQGAGAFASLAQEQSQRDTRHNQTFVNLNPADADEPARSTMTSARSDLYA